MRTALLVLGLLLLPQEDPRLPRLVEQLVDDDINVRERAAAEIIDLGKAAVPLLERLRASGDIELRSRAGAILKAISENSVLGRHWHRGCRVTIDAEAAPLARVLEDLARQGRDAFKFDAAEMQDPVTVKLKDLTFFEALEEVCRAAPALTWTAEGDGLTFTKKRRPPYPCRRQAEFQVWLDGIVFSRDHDFTGNPRVTFTMGVSTAWEAGIAPIAVDQRVTEVLDEDGTNLVPPDRFGGGGRMDVPKGRTRRDSVYAALPQGAKSPKRFARVRGVSTYYFPRAYEEITVDVKASASPPPVSMERMTVAVRNFRAMKDGVACEIVLTASTNSGDGLIDRLPFGELAVVDDQGGLHRGKTSSRSQSYSGTSYTIQENLQLPFPEGRTAVGLKLRVLKDVLEKRLQFEFGDIPVE